MSDIGESTDDEDNTLRDEILVILLLLLMMRGSKVYNAGITMALAAALDISKTSKFASSITDDDTTYETDVIKKFNSDTAAEINKIVAAGTQSGMTTEEIKQQLATFKDSQAYRVERFAQNESWRMSEIAGMRAMTQLDGELNQVQKAGVYKTWKIQPTACPICIDYADVTVRRDQKFFGGIDLPPAHVICRCKVEWSVVKENATDRLELHCASCDRFLGITERLEVTDQLKCANSKCHTLAVPVVRAQAVHN